MTIGEAFGILGISPTDSQNDIQHAFASRSRNAHPEENPEGWSELSQAYQLCMAWAKNKSKPEPTLDEATGSSNTRPESDEALNTDYFDVFRQLDRKQEERKEIEQQLSQVLEQLEAEKVITSLSGYRRALEQLSRLPAFDSDDPVPHRVYAAFRASLQKKKKVPFYRRKMLRLLSDFSETLTLADEMIWVQRSEEGFAALRTALSTRVFPALLWYFLAFAWMCRFFLPTLFAITQPIVTQVSDGAVHYHAYSEDLPKGSYVSAEVREAHWVGMGYWEESRRIGTRSNKQTLRTYHQYLFLQAATAQGESILIPMVDTFTSESLILSPEIGEFFRAGSALAAEINHTGSVSLFGQIQSLDYPGTLQPGVPLWLNPDVSGMDEEMRELLPGVQGAAAQDLTPEEFLEGLAQSEPENQLFTPETMGVFVLEEPPEEGTPLYREEKMYFLQHPVQFLRHSVQPGPALIDIFIGVALFGLLIAFKRGKIPYVVVR